MGKPEHEHLASTAAVVGNSKPVGLPPTLRHSFEASMGHDFSDVKIHESHAPTMLGAKSYTAGNDIFFAPGVYDPHSPEGSKLVGHELTHVIQQRAGVSKP